MALPSWRGSPIRLRLALWYAVSLVAIVTAVGAFVLAALERTLEQQMDDALRVRASRVEREITTGEDERLDPEDVAAGLLELAPLEEFSSPGIYVQVLDQAGRVLASSPNLPRGELPISWTIVEAALAGQEAFANVPAGDEYVRFLAQPVAPGGHVVGVVLVAQSLQLLETTVQRMQQLVGIAAATGVVASVVGGWWLTGRALGPIADITRVARGIATTGRFEQRVEAPPTHDELGELTATINDMLSRLEQTFRHQREFLADASHELRGPLMVVRGNLDLLTLDLPEEGRRESVREAREEVERMSRLAGDLLFLAEVDAHELVEHEAIALDELIVETWDRATSVDDGAHEIVLDRSEPAIVRGDRYRLGQLLWNLVENALRYTPAGGRITLGLTASEEQAEVTVADTGIGIPPEELPRIFERFYRVDPARPRAEGSTGLGLAIVKRIVEAHGGRVDVESRPGQGSTFRVTIPVQGA
jgi:heavy metal sensor kinase